MNDFYPSKSSNHYGTWWWFKITVQNIPIVSLHTSFFRTDENYDKQSSLTFFSPCVIFRVGVLILVNNKSLWSYHIRYTSALSTILTFHLTSYRAVCVKCNQSNDALAFMTWRTPYATHAEHQVFLISNNLQVFAYFFQGLNMESDSDFRKVSLCSIYFVKFKNYQLSIDSALC